jgi:hypothetical protein
LQHQYKLAASGEKHTTCSNTSKKDHLSMLAGYSGEMVPFPFTSTYGEKIKLQLNFRIEK